MVRILIADDHDIVRSGLRRILEAHSNWEVVAEAGDGGDAIRKAVETKPDIAVIDYSLPMVNGIEVTREIRSRSPKTEVLIFTMHDNERLIENLLNAGARGYVLKSDAQGTVIDAIQALAGRQPFFSPQITVFLLQSYREDAGRDTSPLTERERQILQLVVEGHTTKQMANFLKISTKTVESHREAIMKKLELPNLAALVRYAVRTRVIEA